MEGTNRPDEWEVEQGMRAGELPVIDQTDAESVIIEPEEYKHFKDEAAIDALGDRKELFAEELDGWKGSVDYPKANGLFHVPLP